MYIFAKRRLINYFTGSASILTYIYFFYIDLPKKCRTDVHRVYFTVDH